MPPGILRDEYHALSVKYLLENGANGRAALPNAVFLYRLEPVKLILKAGFYRVQDYDMLMNGANATMRALI